MPATTYMPSPNGAAQFAGHLKNWRQKRRISQLDLALASGVSQRHVSFLESGRARPSREMVHLLSETLEVPLRERNDWLIAAGFAPAYKGRPLDHPEMAQVLGAVRMMLTNHAPFPAVAIDRAWKIQMANIPFERIITMLGEDIWARVGGEHRNVARLFFHREGMRPYIKNWVDIAPLLWHRATREAEAIGGEDMKELLAELRQHQGPEILHTSEDTRLLPVLPVELEKDGLHIALFTIISTFGTAQDLNANELRIECFFPANPETEALFTRMAGQ